MKKKNYLKIKNYVEFLKIALKRTRSEADYFIFQKIQGQFLIKYLLSIDINLNDYYILDLANGYGGGTHELTSYSKKVFGLDLNNLFRSNSINQVSGNALQTPFQDNTFDLIICSSLIEHLEQPEKLLCEIKRILKPNQYLYLSYPPFFSINGGHDYAPFHLLGEKAAVILSKFFSKIMMKKKFGKKLEIRNSFKNAYGNWGLYKMTIKYGRQLINNSGFKILDQSTKWIPMNFSQIPIIGEFLTWHIQFLLVNEKYE